ncbi:hypothetical protein EV426DRAFT_20306 [Tirmania nivea]|nr:hypothetical protein EV426DRAFT_20306 [Tirmania nivea]
MQHWYCAICILDFYGSHSSFILLYMWDCTSLFQISESYSPTLRHCFEVIYMYSFANSLAILILVLKYFNRICQNSGDLLRGACANQTSDRPRKLRCLCPAAGTSLEPLKATTQLLKKIRQIN